MWFSGSFRMCMRYLVSILYSIKLQFFTSNFFTSQASLQASKMFDYQLVLYNEVYINQIKIDKDSP